MTPERFIHLADAYGADLAHWPAVEREDARTLLAQRNPQALAALQQAQWLDNRLDTHRAPLADPLLMRQIVASAYASEPPSSFWRRYADWLSRLGFVGVGLAGIAAGMLVASMSLPLSAAPDWLPSVFDHGEAELMLGIDSEEGEQ